MKHWLYNRYVDAHNAQIERPGKLQRLFSNLLSIVWISSSMYTITSVIVQLAERRFDPANNWINALQLSVIVLLILYGIYFLYLRKKESGRNRS